MNTQMCISVTASNLVDIAPKLKLEKAMVLVPYIGLMLEKANANTIKRAAAMLAQVAYESDDFLYQEEIASGAAYEGRKDLGNNLPGDGVKYKGRGFIQLTGKKNYQLFAVYMKIDCVNHPEIVATLEYSPLAAAFYWDTHKCNEMADKDDFTGITRAINGGLNGLPGRRTHWWAAQKALNQIEAK